MKKVLFSTLLAFIFGQNFASSFSDDFESYSTGDYLGVVSTDWTTWSGSTGGAEDVQIVSDISHSGSNSIYFSSSNPDGGPQDVILDFGGEHNTGHFNYSMWMFVLADHAGYFNFQAESTPGEVWTMQCYLRSDGILFLTDEEGINVQSTFPQNQWFQIEIDVDLNTNDWELLLDGNSVATFQNEVYQVASLDIFPYNVLENNNNSAFWIDDVSYEHVPYILPTLNAGVLSIDAEGTIAGQVVSPSAVIRNLGTSTITSFDVTLEYDGVQLTESVSGVSISSLDIYEISFTDVLTLVGGENDVVVTVSNVNSATDQDSADDTKIVTLDIITPAQNRKVAFEEGTGTWCGWCPRGTIFMERMKEKYEDLFIPIAVHNGDPMVNSSYDGSHGFSGYPMMSNERTENFGFGTIGDIEERFLDRVATPAPAHVITSAEYDNQTGSFTATAHATFMEDASGDYRLAVILTEDGVTGTSGDYAQTNYYAGGGEGEMGGYENLGNPVPANQMVYDHVARELIGGFNGVLNSLPSTMTNGETYSYEFNALNISSDYNTNNMHVITLLIAPDGSISNSNSTTFNEAISGSVGIKNQHQNIEVGVFPNPSRDVAFVHIDLGERKDVSVDLYNAMGALVGTRSYGALVGDQLLPVSKASLTDGVYFVKVKIDDQVIHKTIQFVK